MGASALFVQAHDAKNSEILQRCQTPVRENRLDNYRTLGNVMSPDKN